MVLYKQLQKDRNSSIDTTIAVFLLFWVWAKKNGFNPSYQRIKTKTFYQKKNQLKP
jgi:hypothetical protein